VVAHRKGGRKIEGNLSVELEGENAKNTECENRLHTVFSKVE
jgi:hypothetical protein